MTESVATHDEKPARKSIGKRLRFEVLKRDGFRCVYCGKAPPEVTLQVDHVIAVANGGVTEIGNLAASCQPCNAGKSCIPLAPIPDPVPIEERQRIALELTARAAAAKAEEQRTKDTIRLIKDYWIELGDEPWSFSLKEHKDTDDSLRKFIEILPLDEIIDAIEKTHKSRCTKSAHFRYFCGICWNKHYGIDPKKIRAEIDAELKARDTARYAEIDATA
jgi:hypothetical protein